MNSIVIIALALPWLAILFLGWLIYVLIRQYGRALLKQDELRDRLLSVEQRLQELSSRIPNPDPARVSALNTQTQPVAQRTDGLPIGSPAPSFHLPDVQGRERTLDEFLDRPTLVVFYNPDCSFCIKMAPQLAKLPDGGPRVLLISRGDAQVHQRLVEENNWSCDVLLDRGWEITNAFRSNATPTGYLLDTQGHTTTPLLVGAEALMQLYSATPARPMDKRDDELSLGRLHEKEQAVAARARDAGIGVRESRLNRNGLPAGTPAPNFVLPDLQGISHSLGEFRGGRVLLIFSAPDCVPCQTLVPALAALHQRYLNDKVQLVMITRGDLEANRAKAKEHGFSFPVLLQRHWEVSKEYALFATPIAYLIDEQGIIIKDVAIGAQAILDLV